MMETYLKSLFLGDCSTLNEEISGIICDYLVSAHADRFLWNWPFFLLAILPGVMCGKSPDRKLEAKTIVCATLYLVLKHAFYRQAILRLGVETQMPKVLLADDDLELLNAARSWLEHQRWNVDLATSGAEAREYMSQVQYDVLVLDWMMPDATGIELCQWHRSCGGNTPILMLTGKSEITDKEKGLDSGADDYLTKPCDLRELAARLNALLRRVSSPASIGFKAGPLLIDSILHKVLIDGNELQLTATEFSILEFLALHPGQLFSTEALIARVWKKSSTISPQTVRTYIKRLKEKLSADGYPNLLVNIHSVGYKLDINPSKEEQ